MIAFEGLVSYLVGFFFRFKILNLYQNFSKILSKDYFILSRIVIVGSQVRNWKKGKGNP